MRPVIFRLSVEKCGTRWRHVLRSTQQGKPYTVEGPWGPKRDLVESQKVALENMRKSGVLSWMVIDSDAS